MSIVNEIEVGNYRFVVTYDEDSETPRAWSNLGVMLMWHRGYNSPDENPFATPDDFMEWFLEEHASDPDHVLLPLFMLDHGNVKFSTADFGDKWDSGQVGWVYVDGKSVREEGVDAEFAAKIARGEVSDYSDWASGEVYSWTIYEKNGCDACEHDEWNVFESCNGYVGKIDFNDVFFPEGASTEFCDAVAKLLK